MTQPRCPRRVFHVLALMTGVFTLAVSLASTSTSPASAAVPRAGSSAGTNARSGDPDYQRPVVGECHDYNFKTYSAIADPSAAVDCTQHHTALTLAVLTLPPSLSLGGRHTSPKAYTRAGHACLAARDATLGLTRTQQAKTAYSLTYLIPTKRQLSHGAHWIRCDLVLLKGQGLSKLPTSLPGSRNAVRRCLVRSSAGLLTTVCSGTPTYRSTRAVALKGRTYPGTTTMQRIGRRGCQRAPGLTWAASWTTEFEWDITHHGILVCYRPSS